MRCDRLGGLHARAVVALLADRSRRWPSTPGTTSSSIWRAACSGDAAGRRSCGARASRSLLRPSPPKGQDPGRLVGGVYAANTVGAIVGRARRQPAAGHLARKPACAAGADHHQRAVRAARARAASVRAPWGERCRTQPRSVGRNDPDRRRRRHCGTPRAQRAPRFHACSLLTAVTPRPGRTRPMDIIYMGEGLERVGRRFAPAWRRLELSQRRQGPGLERAAGHAPAAHARAPHDADPEETQAACS